MTGERKLKRLVLEGDDRRSLDNTVVTCRNTHTGRAAPIKKYFWIDSSGKILNLWNMAFKIYKKKQDFSVENWWQSCETNWKSCKSLWQAILGVAVGILRKDQKRFRSLQSIVLNIEYCILHIGIWYPCWKYWRRYWVSDWDLGRD